MEKGTINNTVKRLMQMEINELLDKNPTPQSKTTTFCILGQKGTGKTYAMAILAKHLEYPVLFVDTIGAATEKQLLGQQAFYINVNTIDAQKLLNALNAGFSKSSMVVVNLYSLIPREKVYIVDVLSAWAMGRGKVSVFVDEVAFICPQNRSSKLYSDEFHRLVMAGRNYGNVPVVFSTQRPQTANKDVLALADKYLFFRLIHNLDRGKVKDLIGQNKEEWEQTEQHIMTLQTREAFLFYVDKGQRVIKKVLMPELKI
uniref:Putative ATPase domain containing protein n=1 Tax=viral metagenome TaxID=1070528 RepID=A0A6M3IE75_9ZZZZ